MSEAKPEDFWRLRPWSARAVLRAWERGDGAGRTARALAILSVVLPDRSRRELLDLPIGRRDQLLLQSRLDLLGSTLQGSVRCPSCSAEQAFALEVDADLLSQGVAMDAPTRRRVDLSAEGLKVQIRCVDGHDALAVEGWRPTAAWRELIRRCVGLQDGAQIGVPSEAVPSEAASPEPASLEAISPDSLSGESLAILGEEIENLDPLSLVPLAMACGTCEFQWQPLLEIVEIVWAEVENLARRLLDEAQTLAVAYGWSEEQIFAMSGRRRRYYLQNAPSVGAGEEDTSRPFDADSPWSPTS